MKLKEKIWQTEYQGITILVKNSWNFERTSEEIRINGKRVYYRDTPINDVSLKSLTGIYFDWMEGNTKITIRIGSIWYLCGIACQILINGKYYYGDRIVLFAKK